MYLQDIKLYVYNHHTGLSRGKVSGVQFLSGFSFCWKEDTSHSHQKIFFAIPKYTHKISSVTIPCKVIFLINVSILTFYCREQNSCPQIWKQFLEISVQKHSRQRETIHFPGWPFGPRVSWSFISALIYCCCAKGFNAHSQKDQIKPPYFLLSWKWSSGQPNASLESSYNSRYSHKS